MRSSIQAATQIDSPETGTQAVSGQKGSSLVRRRSGSFMLEKLPSEVSANLNNTLRSP
jgi:hypothetical protein